HLVGGTHTGCKGPYAPNCLAETRDGGASWRLIPAPAVPNEQCGPYGYNQTTPVYGSGQDGPWVASADRPDNPNPTWAKINQGANGADTGLRAYRASTGKYYVGTDYGVLEGSSDFLSWTLDTTSPRPITYVVGDGTRLFASSRGKEFWVAEETTPKVWSQLPAAGTPPALAGRWLLYEATHKLLYSSEW